MKLLLVSLFFISSVNAAFVCRGQFGNSDVDGHRNSTTARGGIDVDRGDDLMWGVSVVKHSATVKSNQADPYWGQCRGSYCGNYRNVKKQYEVKTVGLEVSGKHFFTKGPIAYYALGFVGLNEVKISSRQKRNTKDSYVSVGAGVGVDFKIAPQVALNLEGRYESGLGGSGDTDQGVSEIVSRVTNSKRKSLLFGVVLRF